MRTIISLMVLSLLFVSCNNAGADGEESSENMNDELFKKNSQTVIANLEGWQNENLDYSMYSDDFIMLGTGFNSPKDSISLKEMRAEDTRMWKSFDFKMLNEPVLLPGVNADTKEPDGSVRHYSQWKVTRVATDSTDERSGMIKLYESFDFDEEGKIIYQQVYGDFTGLMMHLMAEEEEME